MVKAINRLNELFSFTLNSIKIYYETNITFYSSTYWLQFLPKQQRLSGKNGCRQSAPGRSEKDQQEQQ